MTRISRTFTVGAPPDAVLAYLQDFSNAEQWDPGTVRCVRLDAGMPVTEGSRWRNTSKILGLTTELTYRLLERTPERVVFEGENKSATSTDTITVRPDGGGSRISYDANIVLHGLGRFADPLVKLVFERIGTKTERSMVAVLDALPRPS